MKCLHCGAGLPDGIVEKSGRFACPECKAEHIRRQVDRLPSGEPVFSIRLWGHLASTRRKPESLQREA